MDGDYMRIDRQSVINAFAKVVRPGAKSLCVCQCAECRSEIKKFDGKTWSQLKCEDFAGDAVGASLAILSPAAFCYYLPGVILLVLEEADCTWLVDKILLRLTVSDQDTEERRAGVDAVIQRLTVQQRDVLHTAVDTWRRAMQYAPVFWDALAASLRNGKATCYPAIAVESYNRAVLASHYGRPK